MEGVASARLCYEQGNDVYKSGDYISASQIYSTGIDFYSMGKSCKSTQDGEIEQKLLLNRAQCFLNMREYAFAVKDCTLILAIDNSCVKAYVRRAIAYENLGNFRKGITDTESALSLHPPSSMIDTILKLSTRLRTLSACDERAIAAEGRPDRMVTDRQTLRLNFLESIPREVTIGETFLIRLCIGNEFGLWDKKLLTSTNESQSNKNVAIIDEINQPLKVCIEIIYLDLNEYDASSASSSSSSRNAKKSLTLTRKEENLSVGSDGKVAFHVLFGSENTSEISATLEGLLDEIDDFFVVLRFSLSHALPSGAIIVPILSLPMHVCRSKVNIKEMKSMPVIAASHSDSIDNNRNISEEMKNYESKMQNTMSIGQNVCASCIRESCVGDIIVYVLESPGLLGIGGKVWDSTFVLVDFLQRKGATLVAGKKIVELGSGTGITGLGLCALNPCSVILTDFEEVEPLLIANIELNCLLLKSVTLQNCIRERFSAVAFSWGTDLVCKGDSSSSNSNRSRNNGGNSEVDISSSSRGTDHNENATITEPTSESMDGIERRSRGLERLLDVDVVIASDVVYDPIGYEPLVKSLCELLGGKYIICAGIEIATEISTKIGPEVGTGEGTDTDTGAGAEPKIEFSVERGIEDEHPSYPICILAHRHRHPENQRFFQSLRSQEGIVVQMISRETGDEIIEKNDGTSKINKIVVDSDSDGVSSDTSNMPLDDSSVPTCVLSDVELYKIYFKK